MAAARPITRSMDENVGICQHAGKTVQQGTKRRALGDIGNAAGPLAASKHNGDKEKGGARKPAAPRASKPLDPSVQQIIDAPVRLTRSKTRALAQGVSLSSLLQARSAAATRSSRRSGSLAPSSPLPDIDQPDQGNHLAECQYVNDVYSYFRKVEPRFRAPANYMNSQVDVNEKMRAILVDWLVEVHLKFKLMPESLFLTINLIDRYLAVRQVTRKNLQLVGVTAMLMASKYEEIWAPEVRDFVYISDKAYTRKQIIGTEKDMLQALNYNLSLPTSYQFLARLLKAANVHYEKPLALFVAYCAELCLVDYSMLQYSYSEQAAAIMYVAMMAFHKPDTYPYSLQRHAFHTKASVLHISKEVVKLVQNAHSSSLQAVVKKYSNPKFCEAALVPPPLDILNE